VGNLDQNAGAIARLGIAARCSAMGEVNEHLKALADNLVAPFATNAGNQPHATRIVFIPWMIETLRLRCAETIVGMIHGSLFNDRFDSRVPCAI
jgi:hypothetical protein